MAYTGERILIREPRRVVGDSEIAEHLRIISPVDAPVKEEHLRIMRKWELFTLNKERWTLQGDEPTDMEVYRTPDGAFLGCRFRKRRPSLIKWIQSAKVTAEKSKREHSACSIGRSSEGVWFGWSYRARCGFKAGDKIFREDFPGRTDTLPFVEWGSAVIETEEQAKQAAKNFGAYVS